MGKWTTLGSNTVKVAQLARGSSAPATSAAMPTISAQCGRRSRIDHRMTTPKNPMVNSTDVTLVTSGQLVTPRNGGYGGSPGVGLTVRGSPCRPL